MHSIVVAPGLAKSLFWELDLRDNLRLTYTLITTNRKNRVEQHLTICHQPGHGYHIYLTSIDWLNYLHWLLDLTRTYFNNAACTAGMALAHFRMLIHELLNKYPDKVTVEAPIIILNIRFYVRMAKIGKDTKHTRHIARKVNVLRNSEKCKMHNINWHEGGLQLAETAAKNVG